MDEVSNASSVGSVVVVTGDVEVWEDADGDSGNVRHQVGRRTLWVFAYGAGFVGTDRVEVA